MSMMFSCAGHAFERFPRFRDYLWCCHGVDLKTRTGKSTSGYGPVRVEPQSSLFTN